MRASAAHPTPDASAAHKIFFIGPNKTGTRSWCDLLKSLGLRTLHDGATWAAASRRHDLAFFATHDAFCDGDVFDVAWLAAAFPRATFVFNSRALLPWLVSRTFHAQDGTNAFLAGRVKSLALHNDDATVACWVIQRDSRLRQARELLPPHRLGVLDITAAGPERLLAALQPLLPSAAAALAQRSGAAVAVPHRGERASDRPAQQVQLVEARVRNVLRRLKADPAAVELSGAAWTEAMAGACPRLHGMGGVSVGRGRVKNATSAADGAVRPKKRTSGPMGTAGAPDARRLQREAVMAR